MADPPGSGCLAAVIWVLLGYSMVYDFVFHQNWNSSRPAPAPGFGPRRAKRGAIAAEEIPSLLALFVFCVIPPEDEKWARLIGLITWRIEGGGLDVLPLLLPVGGAALAINRRCLAAGVHPRAVRLFLSCPGWGLTPPRC